MASATAQTKTKPPVTLPPTLDRERLLTVDQVALMMNFSVAHVRRLYYTGKIPKPIKVGGIKNGWRTGVILDFLAAASAQAGEHGIGGAA